MRVKEAAHLAAIAAGESRFVSSRPCKRRHDPVIRTTSGAKCIACKRIQQAGWTERHLDEERARLREYKRNNKAKILPKNAAYRERTRKERRKYNSEYEKRNRAAVTARKKRRRQETLEHCLARDAAYRKKESARYVAHSAAWRADKEAATVPGLPKGWDRAIYAEAKMKDLVVDHKIPLRPCRICGRKGTHEPANLQLLPRAVNASKGRRCQECWLSSDAEGHLRMTAGPNELVVVVG